MHLSDGQYIHTHVHDTQLEGSSIDSCMQTYIDVWALKYVQTEVCAKYAMATRLFAWAAPRSVLCEDLHVDLEDHARGAWRRIYILAPTQELLVYV